MDLDTDDTVFWMSRIQWKCRQRKLTQEQLAELIGVTPQQLTKWMHRWQYPNPQKCDDIADMLNEPREYIRKIVCEDRCNRSISIWKNLYFGQCAR